ncbi:radical SAM protein [Stenotrophomonas sp. NPDC077659]|uniref:radical SAM protein n=1 Tax=Stenotrophomonas sp. NPDC077659 TaxID=3390694 RepID=UPI003CFC50AE
MITTYGCTAECRQCCFESSPRVKGRLSLEEMTKSISDAKHNFPSLLVAVFSGGEATMLKADLTAAIAHATKEGLSTRIVSNGSWGKTMASARKKVAELAGAGLKELNQQWVPARSIMHCAVAAAEHGAQGAARFMLPISRAGVPVEGWLEYSRFSALIEDLLKDRAASTAFNQDPAGYLKSRGMDGSELVKGDANVALLIAMSQPEVKQAVLDKDYRAVISYLQAAGTFSPVSTDALTQRVGHVIQHNRDAITSGLKLAPGTKLDLKTYKELLASSTGGATPLDAAALAAIGDNNDASLILGAFALVVAAVGAAVGVHSVVVAFTWLAIVSSVTVEGDGDEDEKSRSARAYGGLLQSSDPGAQQNIEVAGRLAQLTGSPRVFELTKDELAKAELGAFFAAMKEHRLLDYDEAELPDLVEATLGFTEKSVGIS